jgi:hypothetical protein
MRSVVLLTVLLLVLAPGVCLAVEVAEAVICSDVQDRQPVDVGVAFPADIGKIWCWSKLKDGQGTSIKHIYYYNDEEKAIVQLDIGSPMFRTYSSKRILSSWTGEWRVDIIDADDNVLKSLDFTIGEEMQPEATLPEEAGQEETSEEETGATE